MDYCKRAGSILGMASAKVRQCYIVTSPLIGWTHTQNDSWSDISPVQMQRSHFSYTVAFRQEMHVKFSGGVSSKHCNRSIVNILITFGPCLYAYIFLFCKPKFEGCVYILILTYFAENRRWSSTRDRCRCKKCKDGPRVIPECYVWRHLCSASTWSYRQRLRCLLIQYTTKITA